ARPRARRPGAAAPQAAPPSGDDRGRRARRTSYRARRSIEPLLGGETARLVPLLGCHPFLGDAKGPHLPFRLPGAIGAGAAELRVRPPQGLCAGLARAPAMSVDVLTFRKLHVDGLRVLAADGCRALVIGAPLVTDHDDGAPEGHLRMPEIAVGIE